MGFVCTSFGNSSWDLSKFLAPRRNQTQASVSFGKRFIANTLEVGKRIGDPETKFI